MDRFNPDARLSASLFRTKSEEIDNARRNEHCQNENGSAKGENPRDLPKQKK